MSLLKSLGLASLPQQTSRPQPIEDQSSLRALVSEPLKSPGQTGTKGQNAAILEQKPKSADEIPGMGEGKEQAIGKAEYDKAEELVKAGWNWINKQGETKIIIKNRTSKVMSFVKETDVLDKPGQSKWSRKAAPEIAAGAEDNMVVKTDMTIRGVTRANTSGSVVYEIAGNDHHHIVCRICGDEMQVEHVLLEQLYHKLESTSGYVRIDSHMTFFGVCSACQ